ncbi:hypothetical protein GCM10011386_02300 [Parapedobacter defluvii]|uniref:Uncharacterized protein n=1 Tax=Parapedobacter defluvii TaxID=2045106 RepID=A0ABQ1L0M9_9SPHI|nr:hypothetical protein GCM10011386_02300 [Parapedobacter defluvii]
MAWKKKTMYEDETRMRKDKPNELTFQLQQQGKAHNEKKHYFAKNSYVWMQHRLT